MATLPPPSPASASSAYNSENSASEPISNSPPNPQVDGGAVDNGVFDVDEKKPNISSHFGDLHSAYHIEKFKKYETDYSCWMTAKYFSKKDLYGGNIFDESTTIDDEIIKSSRWPCTRSYADPVQGFEEQSNACSTSTTTTTTGISPNISNGKHLVFKKSG